MNDVTPVTNHERNKEPESKPVSLSRKRSFKNPLSKRATHRLVMLVVAVALLGISFYLGDQNGANRQKKVAENRKPSALNAATNKSTAKRWNAIGTVEDITEKSIKIKNSKGEIQEAAINKDTVITGADGKKTDYKAVKKGSRVIGTGTKDEKDDKKLTATRIRVQK